MVPAEKATIRDSTLLGTLWAAQKATSMLPKVESTHANKIQTNVISKGLRAVF
jgi:hypothetical protein